LDKSQRAGTTVMRIQPGPPFGRFAALDRRARMGTLKAALCGFAVSFPRVADSASMFETSTPSPLKPQVANPAAAPVRPNRLPFELETEFAEMQAAAPTGGVVPALLGTTLLFHVLLIAERSMLALSPVAMALRGVPVTLLLLLFLLLPARMRRREAGRLFSAGFGLLLVVVLLAGEPFAAARQLLPIQTGVGIMLLVLGWLTLLPRSWALVFSGSMLLADVASILPAHPVSLSVKLESLWALVFASALVVVLATVRESEARREFLLLRQAAFAGVPSTEPGSMVDRHLDPETGVANRLAFDMRFRAAAFGRAAVLLDRQLCRAEARPRLPLLGDTAGPGRRAAQGQPAPLGRYGGPVR
jgi:hypothetical protein